MKKDYLPEDFEIVQEWIKNRSESAASEIVKKYQRFIYLLVLRIVKNSEQSKDITQEILVKILNSLEKFSWKSSLKTWIYRVATNYTKSYLRQVKFKKVISIDDDETFLEIPSADPNPEQIFRNKELEKAFIEALSKLPEKQRETFSLRYFHDLPYNEIAEMLGVTVSASKSNYFQATKKLAEALKDYQNLRK
ncbi:MAG TPA: sigma-70 family RNA polymerase sigma factor [Bacteroidota bacterium]|nr:sigma-70 family RNA polymerase sigma factor [Candidatus Kapabacteria bacterium]HRS02115.1 sigma-70 family RNA polymerase sigma factor [Bacteroidota bacterium]HRT67441.1 sigma-70 family RNA polymerase sigma factor [Bacteroidota bacterium]